MYDYFLGGSHNFAADREAAEQVVVAIPNVREIARANRAFLRNAVRHLLDSGIRQFLDVGSGIPTVGNVHEIAQRTAPGCRVVYVDTDPVAVAHSIQLLHGDEHATAIQEDLRQPQGILEHPDVLGTLDLRQPIGLLMISMLHFISDDEAYPAVETLREALAPGSFIAISHVAAEGMPRDRSDAAGQIYRRSTTPTGALRSRAEIERFFDGLDLVEPGLVWVSQWLPGELADAGEHPEKIAIVAGVARKPGA